MIVDLKDLERGSRPFDLVYKADWWQSNNESYPVLGLDGSLACHLDIYRAGIKYVIEGRLSGFLSVGCDRCLEPFRHQLDDEFRLFLDARLSESVQGEVELLEEDLAIHFVKGSKVDLDDIVREQIYLSLPAKSLCRQGCSGLCPVCGTNLNNASCQCRRGEGHPGFSKLKAFKFNGDD